MQRRSFLALLGLSPVAPAVTSDVMTAPAPVPMGGIAQSLSAAQGLVGSSPGGNDGIDDQLRFLVKNGLLKREDIVAMIYAKGERYVVLDADIADMRSFSTTAKMRLQRMRDAERQANSFLEDGYYRELGQLAKRLIGGG